MPGYDETLKSLMQHHLQKAITYRVLFDGENEAHELLIQTLETARDNIQEAETTLQKIKKALETAAPKTKRIYAKALADLQHRPVYRGKITNTLGGGVHHAPSDEVFNDDLPHITHPNDYIILRNNLNHTRFSSYWFFNKSDALIQSKKTNYIEKTSTDDYVLNEAGKARVKTLIDNVLNPNCPYELTDTLMQSDLILMGHYFGRHKVKQILDRYGIYADGSKEHPFYYFHFICLLVGISACDSPQDSLYWKADQKEDYQAILEKIRHATALGFGGSDAIMTTFDRKAQNPIPETVSNKEQFEGLFKRTANQTSTKALAYGAALSMTGGNAALAADLRAYGIVGGILQLTNPNNVCYNNYSRDWSRLFTLSKADNHFSQKSQTDFEEELIQNLMASDSLEAFTGKHKAFNTTSLSNAEHTVLEQYFAHKKGKEEPADNVRELIQKIARKLTLTARMEFMTHNLAYRYTYDNEHFIYNLYTADLERRPFQARGVINDEAGMGVTIFKPALERNDQFEDMDEIPLYITVPGTHDEMSAIRDLFLISPGLHAHSPTQPYRERYMKALNEEVKKLRDRFPGKKIRIEIFGHSLGGADAKNIELSILEALGQNLQAEEPAKIINYKKDIRKTYGQSDPALARSFSQALTNSLGNRRRHFDVRFKDPENRRHRVEDIDAINKDVIGTVCRSSDRSTGEMEELAQARAALIGLMSHENMKFHAHDEDVEGCIVKMSGEKHGLYYVDPTKESLFKKENITARHITAQTGMGMSGWGWLKALLLGKLGATTAHMEPYFYKHHHAKDAFSIVELNKDSTATDVQAYRRRIEEPHKIGDQPYAKFLKGTVVGFRYIALFLVVVLKIAAQIVKFAREQWHRLWSIEGRDVPSEGLRPEIEQKRHLLNEKWEKNIPQQKIEYDRGHNDHGLAQNKKSIETELATFIRLADAERISVGTWNMRERKPEGIRQMSNIESDNSVYYLQSITSIAEQKRASSKITRQYHQRIRNRDPLVEKFYQRTAAYNPGSRNPHHHENYRRQLVGLTNELRCRRLDAEEYRHELRVK